MLDPDRSTIFNPLSYQLKIVIAYGIVPEAVTTSS